MIPQLLFSFADGLGFATNVAATPSIETFLPVNPPLFIIVGIVLIIATIFILFFLKKMIINSVLGGVIWVIAIFVLKINIPFIPSLVISIIIGPAGIGTMLLLNAFGLLV
jgi:hypothetical protein